MEQSGQAPAGQGGALLFGASCAVRRRLAVEQGSCSYARCLVRRYRSVCIEPVDFPLLNDQPQVTLMCSGVTSQEGADRVEVMRFDWVPVGACKLDITIRAFALRQVERLTGLGIDNFP